MTTPPRTVLLDIEGTTCPVSFVSTVLFPYAAAQVGRYLERHGKEPEIEKLLIELQNAWNQETATEARELLLKPTQVPGCTEENGCPEHGADKAPKPRVLLHYIDWLIRHDRKLTAWKDLQGRIWQEGYAKGDLKAELFPEVAGCLRRWKHQGLELAVYSSGSVTAQHLLYGHSSDGDLRDLFSHWFDTRIGTKQERESYGKIVSILGCQPEEVLFISDVARELRAASAAGMQVVFSDRPGNPERDPSGYRSIRSLEELNSDLTGI